MLIWRSCKLPTHILNIFVAYPYFWHIVNISLIWVKSNLAKGWCKIYCSNFTTVWKTRIPKSLSYFYWKDLLETVIVLNKNCILHCRAFLYFHNSKTQNCTEKVHDGLSGSRGAVKFLYLFSIMHCKVKKPTYKCI